MVFLVLSSFFYAFNNLLWKRLLSKFDLWLIIGFRCLLTSCIGLAIIFLFYPTIFSALTYAVSIKIIVASIFGAFGLISMILALKEGSLTQLGVFNLLIVFLVSLYLVFFDLDKAFIPELKSTSTLSISTYKIFLLIFFIYPLLNLK